jgi:hypothetical protein
VFGLSFLVGKEMFYSTQISIGQINKAIGDLEDLFKVRLIGFTVVDFDFSDFGLEFGVKGSFF